MTLERIQAVDRRPRGHEEAPRGAHGLVPLQQKTIYFVRPRGATCRRGSGGGTWPPRGAREIGSTRSRCGQRDRQYCSRSRFRPAEVIVAADDLFGAPCVAMASRTRSRWLRVCTAISGPLDCRPEARPATCCRQALRRQDGRLGVHILGALQSTGMRSRLCQVQNRNGIRKDRFHESSKVSDTRPVRIAPRPPDSGRTRLKPSTPVNQTLGNDQRGPARRNLEDMGELLPSLRRSGRRNIDLDGYRRNSLDPEAKSGRGVGPVPHFNLTILAGCDRDLLRYPWQILASAAEPALKRIACEFAPIRFPENAATICRAFQGQPLAGSGGRGRTRRLQSRGNGGAAAFGNVDRCARRAA